MAKLWSELFELMFGPDANFIKRGESVSNTITNVKKANNDIAKNTIGLKVDGRILCKFDTANEILDICQTETAKSTDSILKNITNRAKLAIESKCIKDNTVSRPNFPLTKHF